MQDLDSLEINAPIPVNLNANGRVVVFKFSTDILVDYLKAKRITKRLQACTMIAGILPDVNLIENNEEFVSLKDTKFIFKGIKRNCHGSENGSEIYVYITHPTVGYRFVPSMSGSAEKLQIPSNRCLATYIKFIEGEDNKIIGQILTWNLVEADNDGKPIDHETRYEEEVELDV